MQEIDMHIGDAVTGVILAGVGNLNGSIIGMESNNVIVEFPPNRPFPVRGKMENHL